MPRPTPQQYLESKVLTASQPQLHMMLLDGALRFVSQAHAIWADGEEAADVDLLLGRAMDVLEELAQGVTNGSTKISEEMEEQYAFLYREIAASRINQDLSRLSKCLELLTYQRETWKLACARIDTAEVAPKAPKAPPISVDTGATITSFSFEA